jgi:hypothetical protein
VWLASYDVLSRMRQFVVYVDILGPTGRSSDVLSRSLAGVFIRFHGFHENGRCESASIGTCLVSFGGVQLVAQYRVSMIGWWETQADVENQRTRSSRPFAWSNHAIRATETSW